jgi:Uma2 family endonuclease
MTVEEYQALTRQDSDVKYEYIDGHVYAMAGGTLDHSAIGGNIVAALGDLLDNSPCRVYDSDAKVRLSATHYVFPDATVTCDPHDQGTEEEIASPRVVFEVLSESTEAHDRGRKFRWYRGCPSIEEYVLVATESRQVEVFRRRHDAEIWEFTAYAPDDMLDLRSLGVTLSVARLYRNTTIPTADEPL